MAKAKRKIGYAGKRSRRSAPTRKRRQVLWWIAQRGNGLEMNDAAVPAELRDEFRDLDTGFEDLQFTDYAFWLTEAELVDAALRAIERADRTGGHEPVIELLRSNAPLTDFGRRLLADWITRTSAKRPGPKSIPIYALEQSEAMLYLADESLKIEMEQNKTSLELAAEKTAPKYDVSVDALLNHHRGRLGSTRRARQRRRQAFRPG